MTYIPELSGSQALGAGEIRDRYPHLAWTTYPMDGRTRDASRALRRFHVHISLTEEGKPEILATKHYRVKEDDIDGALYCAEIKRRELFRDMACLLGLHYKALDVELGPLDSAIVSSPSAHDANKQ